MRFWDTSALIPLLIEEKSSATIREILAEDREVLTSAFTAVEIASAIWRRRHANEIAVADHQQADVLFADLSTTWAEVMISQDVIDAAIGAMSRHPLRAGDALQLGTALVVAGSETKPVFVFWRRAADRASVRFGTSRTT